MAEEVTKSKGNGRIHSAYVYSNLWKQSFQTCCFLKEHQHLLSHVELNYKREGIFFFFAATRESVLLKLIVWVFSLLRISCFAGFLYVATQTFHSEATYFCGEFKLCCNTVEDSSFHVSGPASLNFFGGGEMWKLRQSLEHRNWKFTLINIYL